MKCIILYGSQYGTTQRYAEKLSELTQISAYRFDEVHNLSAYDLVIHLGGLYAGGVTGLKHTLKLLPDHAKFFLITVGLADVLDEENTTHIRQSIRKQLPEDRYRRTELFHLRGGIDYAKLSWKHRTMMAMLYRTIKKRPPETLRAEDNALLQTYNQKVDFVDFQTLDPVVQAIQVLAQ